jgi:hypothetical protein
MTGVSGLANVGVDIIVRGSELACRHNRQVTRVGDDYTSGEYNIGIMGVEVPEVTRHRSCSGRQICQILGGSKRRGRKIVVADRCLGGRE